LQRSKGFPIWRRYDWALNALPDGKHVVVSGRMTTVVSEEKKASEKELIDFLNKAPIAMHWLSGTGHVLWANETEMNVLGYTAEEYIGQPIMNFCPDERELVLEIFKTLGSGNTIKDVPVRFRKKNGEIVDLLIDSNVNWNTDGSFKHTRCFIRDDTARKIREARLSEMAIRDRELVEQKSAFVRKTFHEIRTPCHLLRHLLSNFEDVTSEYEKESAFKDIIKQVNRLNRLVDDSVDAALFDSGKVPVLERRPFNLVDTINDVLQSLEDSTQRSVSVGHLVSFRSETPTDWSQGLQIKASDVNPWFKGDAKKIGRVVEHLLDNALKFTSKGTVSLDVNISPGLPNEETLVFLTVRDTGPGMNETQVQNAFSKYWQDMSAVTTSPQQEAAKAGSKADEINALLSKLSDPSKSLLIGNKSRRQSVLSSQSSDHGSQALGSHSTWSPTVDAGTATADSEASDAIGKDYEEVQGLGVGLNVINNIVQCMGGSLEFETKPGETTFVICLGLPAAVPPTSAEASSAFLPKAPKPKSPLPSLPEPPAAGWCQVEESPLAQMHVDINPAEPSPAKEEKKPPPVGLAAMTNSKPNVLLVDDNMICLKVLSNLVGKLGCTYDTAQHGLEAVQKVSAGPELYDLVFMDLRMPVLDGIQAAKIVQELTHRKVPIVALTAEVGAEVREDCMEAGFDGFISKPAGRAVIKSEIERLVINKGPAGISIM